MTSWFKTLEAATEICRHGWEKTKWHLTNLIRSVMGEHGQEDDEEEVEIYPIPVQSLHRDPRHFIWTEIRQLQMRKYSSQ